MDQREWDYGARLPRDRQEESWSTPTSPENTDSSTWPSPADTGSLQPIPEAVLWAQRAEAWAQQPEEPGGDWERPVSRWSDAMPTGEGVGWRTETAEWRATEQTARWTQTTEWRSASGTHGWRSTTEAWHTGAGAEGFLPSGDPSTRQQPAISGTAWPTPGEAEVDAGSTPAARQQYSGPPAQQYSGPPAQQYSGPPAQQYSGPPAQQYSGPPAPRAPEPPAWQQMLGSPAPARPAPNTIDGRHLVREDDRAQWRESAAGMSAAEESGRTGHRRAEGRSGSGTGWATSSDADHWAGHTDTGSMPLYEAPPPTWGAASGAGGWAGTGDVTGAWSASGGPATNHASRQAAEPARPSWQPTEPERPSWPAPEAQQPTWQPADPQRPSWQPADPQPPSWQTAEPQRPGGPASHPGGPIGYDPEHERRRAPSPQSWASPSTPTWSTPAAEGRDATTPNRPADTGRRGDDDRPSWARSESPGWLPASGEHGGGRRRWIDRSQSHGKDDDRAAALRADDSRPNWARRSQDTGDWRPADDTAGWQRSDDTAGWLRDRSSTGRERTDHTGGWVRDDDTSGWTAAGPVEDGPSRRLDRRRPQLEPDPGSAGRRQGSDRSWDVGSDRGDEDRFREAPGRWHDDEAGNWRGRADWRAEADSGSWGDPGDADDDWRRDPDTGAWERTRERLVRPPGAPEAASDRPGLPPGTTGTRLGTTGTRPGDPATRSDGDGQRPSGRRTPPVDPWTGSAESTSDTGNWRTSPDGPRPGGRRRAEDRPVNGAGAVPISGAPARSTPAAPVDPEVFRRDNGPPHPGSNWPDARAPEDWRRELRDEARRSYPDYSDAPTEIRQRIDPAMLRRDADPEPFGGPAAWQREERERQDRGTAPYREGGTGDWRRDLAVPSDLAEGESRRFSTEAFVPFRPVGSARVTPPPELSANIPTSPPVSAQPSIPTSPPPAGPRPVSSPGGRSREEMLVGAERSTGARWQDPPDTQWPPRGATGSFRTGAYERRAGGSLNVSPSRPNLLDPDDDELDQKTGGPLAAVGYTIVWYGVPVVLFVLYMLVLNGSQQAHALSTLAHAAPQFGLSLVLSMIVAVGLRWASGSWKAASVGLAAAVMGGGLATVLSSAITGNALT